MVVADTPSVVNSEADSINRRLMTKISNQAYQLAAMNEDICAAAEYIKLCEHRLTAYETIDPMVPTKADDCEQIQRDSEDCLEKLEERIKSKDQLYVNSEKRVADLSKDLRIVLSKLQTSQDSLRLANFLAGPKTAAHQSKMVHLSTSGNVDYRDEMNNLRTKLEAAKLKEKLMTNQISHLEDALASQSGHVHISGRNLMTMKPAKQDQQPDKQIVEIRETNIPQRAQLTVGIRGDCRQNDKNKSVTTCDVENEVNSAHLIEMKNREDRIFHLEDTVRHLEEKLLVAEMELKSSRESASRVEILEDERDSLLEFIQVNVYYPVKLWFSCGTLMISEMCRSI